MKSRLLLLFTLFGFIFIQAQPTKITVRAKAKDAKFIGTSVGGALILIRNADTGELLASGRTEGSTGNKPYAQLIRGIGRIGRRGRL